MKTLAIKRMDGGISILDVVDGYDINEVIAKWELPGIKELLSYREIIKNNLPLSRAFREAWTDDEMGQQIDVDMSKARAIKTDHIRPERNERLAALDIDYMRADEAGDTTEKERVAVVKQELRDLPATIQPDLDAIDQTEELEAYEPTWPTEPSKED